MNLPDEKREQLHAEAAKHRAGGYIVTEDGHRECYCGHVMAPDESYEAHLADALAPLLAEWLAEARAEAWRGRAMMLARARAEGEARVRARVEAVCAEWWATSQRGEQIIHHAGIMQDIVTDVRAVLAADAAETTGGGE